MLSREDDNGPFDIIGDVHGCIDELTSLLTRLGYTIDGTSVQPPAGRKAIFLGDIVNRGPDIPAVLRLVSRMVTSGTALCVAGNHDLMLLDKLEGRPVAKENALTESLQQLDRETPAFRDEVTSFIRDLPAYITLDGGRLVVAHAGLPEELHGKTTPEALSFATNGRKVTDAAGNETRYQFAPDYRGAAFVVYGHYSQVAPAWLNGTVCIDTGCVYGGRLTALRYPERELVSVRAARVYKESRRRAAEFAAARQSA